MSKIIQEFKDFALKGNAIDLAVGVIIGAAFSNLVNSLVNDIISPIVGIFARADLSALSFYVNGAQINYGAFLTALINFFILAWVIFLLLKLLRAAASWSEKRRPTKPSAKS